MSSLEQLFQACSSALSRSPWELHKYLVYLQHSQLLSFAKDAGAVPLDTLLAWGLPARLALEIKFQSGIFSKRPILLYAVHRWLQSRGKRKDMDEWSVSSDDVRFASFRLEPLAHTRAKDFISAHIQTFLFKFRLRRRLRKDAKSEVALWLKTIASVLGLSSPSLETELSVWRTFLVQKHWIRTIEDLRCVPEELWQRWSVQGALPFKVCLLLRRLETAGSVPSNFPVLPATVKRQSAACKSAEVEISVSRTRKKETSSRLATLAKSNSATTASTVESPGVDGGGEGWAKSSLKTLQEKLLEFTQKRNEEDGAWVVRNFRSRGQVEGVDMELRFGRRQSRWYLEVRDVRSGEERQLVNLLTVSKVARGREESRVLVRHREAGENKELVIECNGDTEKAQSVSKNIRKVINWAREQSFLN